MKPLAVLLASVALLVVFLAPAMAQSTGSPSPGPEEEKMAMDEGGRS